MPKAIAMKYREAKLKEWRPIHRFAFLLLGLMLIGTGTFSLLKGRTHYPNVWGAAVFAPFVIFSDFLCLVAAFTLWKKNSRN
jgi:hypothetical protein